MPWNKTDKEIYDRIMDGEINFPENSINLEVIIELVALQNLSTLDKINSNAFNESAVTEMILTYDDMCKYLPINIFNNRNIMLPVIKEKPQYYRFLSDEIKNDFDSLMKMYIANPLVVLEAGKENINSHHILELLNEDFCSFAYFQDKLTKEEKVSAIGKFLNDSEQRTTIIRDADFSDATLEQARDLVKYNFENFQKININYRKDLTLVCNALSNMESGLKLRYIADKFKNILHTILIEGFLKEEYDVNVFLKMFNGNITEGIWGAMICNKPFLDKMEKMNIDPFVVDTDYNKYVRSMNLKEKIEEQTVPVKANGGKKKI